MATHTLDPPVEHPVRVRTRDVELEGTLALPHDAAGLHGHNPAFAVTDPGEDTAADHHEQNEPYGYLPLEFQGMLSLQEV